MSMRLGVIGAGGIGAVHAEAASKAGVRIVGVCDADAERGRSLAGKYDKALATTSIDELLALPKLDAVVVAVPNCFHKEYAIAALKAGKDVLLEKPMALSAAECDEIIDVMKQTDRIVQLGFVCRCAPTTQMVRRFIDAGRFGRIYYARAQWYRRRGIPGLGRWFTTKSQSGGGVLIDLGVHMIDLMMDLAGRPSVQRVSGVCTSVFGPPIADCNCTDMWAGPPN